MQNLQQNQINSYGFIPPNLLINSGFEIWQRGVGSFIGNNVVTADEWVNDQIAGSTITTTKEVSIVKNGTSSLKTVIAGTGVGNGLDQGIEAYKSLEGLTLTFSVWVKTTDSGAFILIQDWDGTASIAVSNPHSGGGNWERLTCVKTIRTGLISNPFWPHGFGLRVEIATLTTASTIYVDGASLVVGNFPEGVPFVPTDPSTDQTRCERFYESFLSNGYAFVDAFYYDGGPPGIYHSKQVPFRTKKYSSPTVSISGFAFAGVATGGIAAFFQTVDGFILQVATFGPGGAIAYQGSWFAEVS